MTAELNIAVQYLSVGQIRHMLQVQLGRLAELGLPGRGPRLCTCYQLDYVTEDKYTIRLE